MVSLIWLKMLPARSMMPSNSSMLVYHVNCLCIDLAWWRLNVRRYNGMVGQFELTDIYKSL